MDVDNDAKIVGRLAALSGYQDIPAVDDTFLFHLPPFHRRALRYVRSGLRVWEIWSPNSHRAAYYPGRCDPARPRWDHVPPRLRRSDGHLGRFDPCVSPQLLDRDAPWLPYIRQSAPVERYPEYTPFLAAWNETEACISSAVVSSLQARLTVLQSAVDSFACFAEGLGKFWTSRPLFPTPDDVHLLEVSHNPEAFVDAYWAVVSGMKELSAWSRFAEDWRVQDRSGIPFAGPVPVASFNYVGVWINGCSEREASWYLRLGIPCFVIHEIDTVREWFDVPFQPLSSFTASTAIAQPWLLHYPDYNGNNHLARTCP